MRQVILAATLVLVVGCVSYDEEPCSTLGCVKRVEYRECMREFSDARMRRGYVIKIPEDTGMYQMRVCQDRVAKIRVY